MSEGPDSDRPDCASVIAALRQLPHTAEFTCSRCDGQVAYRTLDVYAECPGCGTRHKTRSLGAHPELQDVMGAVLEWLSAEPDFERVIAERERLFPA